MFPLRKFLRIAYDVDHRITLMVFQKSTKSDSKLNGSIIKSFNKENKYLYGNLIETQKQRRAKILKNKKNEETSQKVNKNLLADSPIDKISGEIDKKVVAVKKTKSVRKSKIVTKNDKLHNIEESEKCSLSDNNSISVNGVTDNNKASPILSNVNNVDFVSDSVNINESNTSSPNEIIFSKTIKNKNIHSVPDNFKTTTSKSQDIKSSNFSDFPLENVEKGLNFVEPVGEIQRITIDDPEVKNKFSNFPSVSKIISATMSESSLAALNRWRTRMISELGEEGFQAHYRAQLNRGSEFHETIRKKLMGETASSNNEAVSASLNSLQWVWPLISSTIAVETHTAHPRLCYRGVIDCVAKFKETPVVIEWKLSDKPKPQLKDTYDAPIQLSAYVGALNYDNNFKFQVNHGLVVVAYSSGSPADAFFLAPKHCEAYWKIWLARLNKFNNMERLHTDHDIPTVL